MKYCDNQDMKQVAIILYINNMYDVYFYYLLQFEVM